MSNFETASNYANDCLSGKIIACKFVKQACQRWLNDLKNPLYYYNEPEADSTINFIQNYLYLT